MNDFDNTLRYARVSRMLAAVLLSIILVPLNSCDTTQSRQEAPSDLQIQFRADRGSDAVGLNHLHNQDTELVIDEIKLFIDEMELEGENIELEMRNFIVNLPLDGSPFIIAEQRAPNGLYTEFELEIEKPDDDVQVDDRDFRDETGSYSVVVKGIYNGEEFTFRSREDFEIDVDLDPPLEISESENTSLTVSVDISSWFRGKEGETLDPKDFKNTERINKNIEKSFEVFEDLYDD